MPRSDEAALDRLLLQNRIEQFYYHEAELLDDRRFDQWFELLAEDIRYFMPLRMNRDRRELHLEYTGDRESAYFDEDLASMATRMRKLACGASWAG